jgi:CheY-like chemotaxis protein
MSERVLIAEDNLFFVSRLESSLRAAGFETHVVTSAEALEEALGEDASALLVGLASARVDWRTVVRRARELKGPSWPIVGFGPHVQSALPKEGREAGCSGFVANGKMAEDAPSVVRRYLR